MSVQPGTGVVVEEDVIAQRAQKVEGLFKQQLSLDPYERGRVYTTYLVSDMTGKVNGPWEITPQYTCSLASLCTVRQMARYLQA